MYDFAMLRNSGSRSYLHGSKPKFLILLIFQCYPKIINSTNSSNVLPQKCHENKTQCWQKEMMFVNIATLSAGSIFAIGENMVKRSIVAKNIVQCLEIPTFWLLERSQNIGNIWQRYSLLCPLSTHFFSSKFWYVEPKFFTRLLSHHKKLLLLITKGHVNGITTKTK